MPKSNVDFWREKLSKNAERDKACKQMLEALGWRVFYVWECQLNHPKSVLTDLVRRIKSL